MRIPNFTVPPVVLLPEGPLPFEIVEAQEGLDREERLCFAFTLKILPPSSASGETHEHLVVVGTAADPEAKQLETWHSTGVALLDFCNKAGVAIEERESDEILMELIGKRIVGYCQHEKDAITHEAVGYALTGWEVAPVLPPPPKPGPDAKPSLTRRPVTK